MLSSQFRISEFNGFLPIYPPLTCLPQKYAALEQILQEMPVCTKNGKIGLLGNANFGATITTKFPLLDVSEENNPRLVTALFRDYSYLASAYIFEPCYHNESALPRTLLPPNIAIPLVQLSQKLDTRPFLDYAHSYILYNWQKKDSSSEDMSVNNLSLIRSFTGFPSEEGFVCVTVAINHFSGSLIKCTKEFLIAVENKDGNSCSAALRNILETMKMIYEAMGKMWTQSQHKDFTAIRNWINGTMDLNNFPNGLEYQGINVTTATTRFRGVSAAADSIIPLLDAILGLRPDMEPNELTKTLQDFHSYRPKLHQEFLNWVTSKCDELKTKEFVMQANPLLFLQILDQVRQFRTRHWRFIKMYIIKYSTKTKGSGGGSLNLLPNVKTVLNQMQNVIQHIQQNLHQIDSVEKQTIFNKIVENTTKQWNEVQTELEQMAMTLE